MAFELPSKWEVGLWLFGLLSFIVGIGGGCAAIYKAGGDAREDKIMLAQTTAANDSLQKAQKEILDGIQNLQAIEDEIYADPGADDCGLSPGLARELDRVYPQP